MDGNYQEALRRIGNAANMGVTELDLSSLGLRELPPDLWQLKNLIGLKLGRNQLSSLSSEIASLNSLRTLNISDNIITILPREIGKLKNLTSLIVAGNHLTEFPREIGELSELKILDASSNSLKWLCSEIGQLTNLEVLNLFNNELSNLPTTLGALTNLFDLFLEYNQLAALPVELGGLPNLRFLNLDRNPLTSPPPEIVELGTQAILGYLRELAQGSDILWLSKLIVVGEAGVGKTTLVRRLRGEAFDPFESTTHGISILPLVMDDPSDNVEMTLNAWDFGGQEIYHATHQFFLTNRSYFFWSGMLDLVMNREDYITGWIQSKLLPQNRQFY